LKPLPLAARQPVFVLNFEPLDFEFVCNLWFVICDLWVWFVICDFPASRAFLVPARPGYVLWIFLIVLILKL